MSTHQLFILVTFVLAASIIIDQSESNNRYCGKALVDTLKVLCSDKYNPVFNYDQVINLDGDSSASFGLIPLQSRQSKNGMMGRLNGVFLKNYRRYRRGITEECCQNPCSISVLKSYCAE